MEEELLLLYQDRQFLDLGFLIKEHVRVVILAVVFDKALFIFPHLEIDFLIYNILCVGAVLWDWDCPS